MDLIYLINWINKYYGNLEPFGFEDKRLINSTKVLGVVFGKKIFKTNVGIIFNILLEVNLDFEEQRNLLFKLRDSKPLENADGFKITHGPYDLFKILNETFELYNRCRHHDIATRLIKIIKNLIVYYQTNLDLILVKYYNVFN